MTAAAADAPEVVEAKGAEEKPLSKKEKKRRAKELVANGQITGEPGCRIIMLQRLMQCTLSQNHQPDCI